ncbi:MAG: ribonuclease D [Actinobacteria bacterium]|nr:ribonuclease D [Actinomycetota bacterium]
MDRGGPPGRRRRDVLSPRTPEPAEPRRIATTGELEDLVAEMAGADAYAVDTEFHRERTYFPQLALVQLAWRDQVALVDPLAVDVAPLAAVLAGPGEAVMHAAAQDLEVLDLACGTLPSRLFDTQIAAGFAGYGTPSLAALVEGELGIRLPKGDRLTDWLRRPLDAAQSRYAASDVAHLLELRRRLEDRLTRSGRLDWALDECEAMRSRGWAGRAPEDAWLRIKEARTLRGRAQGVARSVAAWRERRAADQDQPVRHVLPDLAIVAIAQRAPTTADQLRSVRGLDGRHLRSDVSAQILEAVQAGLHAPPPEPRAEPAVEIDRDLRPAVTLVSAWLSQLARDLRIETSLLGTRADIEALLSTGTGRLTGGWRADLVGEPIRRLVDGDAALAFDGGGRLVLEARSGEPIVKAV